jgi:hypothetical protein
VLNVHYRTKIFLVFVYDYLLKVGQKMKVIVHYIKRAHDLGFYKSLMRIASKTKECYIYYRLYYKAHHGKAASSWKLIQKKYDYSSSFFVYYRLLKSKKLSFLEYFYSSIDGAIFIYDADLFVSHCFNLLGSGCQQFVTIPWHEDFRLKYIHKYADTVFDDRIFCRDRAYMPKYSNSLCRSSLGKDLKVPWELSRGYQFFVLGKAYSFTKNVLYADAFIEQITDWMNNNSYLFGVNWMCPMEVGIRAINWIIAMQFFHSCIPEMLAERIICCLYDHLVYLENHWETYDGRTSNHYMANLIGYYYLCWYFNTLPDIKKKAVWCYTEILHEWDKQVFEEGTDYEGSTAYHRLVTEMLYHFYLLTQEFDMQLPRKYLVKLYKMLDFIEWCTSAGGVLVTIGDDDSGKILYYGLPRLADIMTTGTGKVILDAYRASSDMHTVVRSKQKYYPRFGISIIKTDQWHITLRHHSYQRQQPSGHYHADAGSFTLSYGDRQLFVDPGSYIYTPSVYWRNYFRSYKNHNTFFLSKSNPIPATENLFELALPECIHNNTAGNNEHNVLEMEHDLYAHLGIRAHRCIKYGSKNQIIIVDEWRSIKAQSGTHHFSDELITCWNFVLDHEIDAQECDTGIMLFYKNKKYAYVSSLAYKLTISNAWVACGYGVKKEAYRICARKKVRCGDLSTLVIQGLL